MGTILGLDLGQKRIGVAVADEVLQLATPHTTLHVKDPKSALIEIKKVAAELKVSKIVVGLPKNLKGELGPSAQQVMAFVEKLKEQITAEWIFWDERLSTKEVERVLIDADVDGRKRRMVQDQLAAQRILQGYLDNQRHIANE